jgi:WD40 repeat protein
VLHAGPEPRLIELGPQMDVRNIAVSPDGRWVATGSFASESPEPVIVWEAATGKRIKVLPAYGMAHVSFSPDGRWLAIWCGGCRLWSVGTWEPGPDLGGSIFAFAPDSQQAVVSDGHQIRLVSLPSGRTLARLEDPHQDRPTTLTFTPDGTRVIAANWDSDTIHVWDLRALREGLVPLGLDWDAPPYR